MSKRVYVRRDHPTALTWAIALVLTMLAVYLVTVGNVRRDKPTGASFGEGARVTEEVRFEPLSLSCISFGRFVSAQDARVAAAKYTSRGAAGYVALAKEGSIWTGEETEGSHVLLAAGYDDPESAQRVGEGLRRAEGIDCAVYTETAAGVLLRIAAPEGAVSALAEAEVLLRTHARDLKDLALLLDRGETEPGSACTLIAVMAGQANTALERLRAIPAGQDPVLTGLIALVEEAASSLTELAAENTLSPLSLSGKIKYNHIGMTLAHIRYLNTLNGI